MLRLYRKPKLFDLITGLCFMLVVLFTATGARADTDPVIFQNISVISQSVVEQSDSQATVLSAIQYSSSLFQNEQALWNVGFAWSDKFLNTDGLEVISFIITLILQ